MSVRTCVSLADLPISPFGFTTPLNGGNLRTGVDSPSPPSGSPLPSTEGTSARGWIHHLPIPQSPYLPIPQSPHLPPLPHPQFPSPYLIPIRSVQGKVREKLGLCKDPVITLATNTDSSYIEQIAESYCRNVNNIVHYNESFFSQSIKFSFRPFDEYKVRTIMWF